MFASSLCVMMTIDRVTGGRIQRRARRDASESPVVGRVRPPRCAHVAAEAADPTSAYRCLESTFLGFAERIRRWSNRQRSRILSRNDKRHGGRVCDLAACGIGYVDVRVIEKKAGSAVELDARFLVGRFGRDQIRLRRG